MHVKRQFCTVPAVWPQNSWPGSSWEQSQGNAQEPVDREQSFLEEHILEVPACGWVHSVHRKNLDKCLQVSVLCQVLCYALGMGSGPAAIFFLSAPSRGMAETWSLYGPGKPILGKSRVDSEGGKSITEKQNSKKNIIWKKSGCQPCLKPPISKP